MLEKTAHQVADRIQPVLAALRSSSEINVSFPERIMSGLAGGVLTGFGLARKDWLGSLMALAGGALVFRGVSGHCHVYGAMGMDTATAHNPDASVDATYAVRVDRSIVIGRDRAQVYGFWRKLENLPAFMSHIEGVHAFSPTRSRWRMRGPMGRRLEWDAKIINDVPGEVIAWRSLEGSDVMHAGSVRFKDAPGGGTRVELTIEYQAPGASVGTALLKLLGQDPATQIEGDLRELKGLLEQPPHAVQPALEALESPANRPTI